MIRKEIRFWTVTARLVIMLVLLTGFASSVWADGITVKSYLTSESDLPTGSSSNSKMKNGGGVTWDANENAAFFHGFSWSNNNYLEITDSPFANVTASTGFALSMEFKMLWGDGENYTTSAGTEPSNPYIGPWSRLFSAYKNQEDANGNTGYTFEVIAVSGSSSTQVTYNGTATYVQPVKNENVLRTQMVYQGKNTTNVTVPENQRNNYFSDSYKDKKGEGWHNLTLLLKSGEAPKMYIDGVEISITTDGTDDNYAYKHVINDIKNWPYLCIGRSPYKRDRCFYGWVRNVMIVPSGQVAKISLSSALSNGSLKAAVSGSSSIGETLTTGGIMLPKETSVQLTAIPNTGYRLNTMTVAGNTVSTTNNAYTFTLNNETTASATFTEREYSVVYDPNNEVTVGGQTTTETVTGMPAADNTQYKYFTQAFTFPPNTPTRVGYTFKGWSNVKTDPLADNTSVTKYTAGSTVDADNTSSPTSAKGKLSSTVSDQNVLTLYAIWRKNDHTLTSQVVTQNYDGSALNETGGTVTLARALETTPNTWAASSTVQYKDRVKINTTNSTDFHLKELKYAYSDATEGTIEIANTDNVYASIEKLFTMEHAVSGETKTLTITAVFVKNQPFEITSVGFANSNTMTYLVTHNNTETEAALHATSGKPTAYEFDIVKLKAGVTNGYILRTVTYQFAGEENILTLYDNKTKNESGKNYFTTPAFTMLGKNVTVTATFLADRIVSVGGHSERGTITMTGTYVTSDGNVTTDATTGNAMLSSVHSGDLITVTATPTAGWHFDISKTIAELFPLTNGGTPTEVTKTLESASMTFTMPDNNVTVAGAFTENQYTIRYDAQGGSAVSDQTKKHFESLVLSTTVPTKADCTFMGWATSETDAQKR